MSAASTRKWAAATLGVAMLWFAASSLLHHPDYLAYFNEFADSEPERIVVDSDLDWGQDAKRLATRLRELGAKEATFVTFPHAEFEREHGFPRLITNVDVLHPNPGWNAVGLSYWKERRMGLEGNYPNVTLWPDRLPPNERVGKSILLWYFPPDGKLY